MLNLKKKTLSYTLLIKTIPVILILIFIIMDSSMKIIVRIHYPEEHFGLSGC